MKHFRQTAILLAILLFGLAACAGPTSVVFDNQTVCGTIAIRLTNLQTGVVSDHEVAMGEQLVVEITPDVTYNYEVDYTAAGENAAGYRCTDILRGEVEVGNGSTQTFNLTAVTPTPGATPAS